MAEKNLVTITGYLKENTLEQVVSKTGKNAIRGNLIIATSAVESHKIQFYVSESTSNGTESKDYKNLLALLPEKTITIASYLKANPEADFESACMHVSKIWAAGSFDEYARKTERGEISSIQLRGRRAGFKAASIDRAFEPKAKFEVEMYISEMIPELDIKGDETGRLKITGLLQNYDQSVNKIEFIAPVEDGIASYIAKNYNVSDTAHVYGELINIVHKVLVESASENCFGSGGRDQYETKFVNERKIVGGDKKAIREGEDGSITKNAVKIGLAKREGKIMANSTKAAAPRVSFDKTGSGANEEDVDF